MLGKSCPICGEQIWVKIETSWVRCATCGRLETIVPDRKCAVCGKPLGKYAKPRATTCLDCRNESHVPIDKKRPCMVPSCPNRIGKSGDAENGWCAQCLTSKRWSVPDGHLWKQVAMKMLEGPLHREKLKNKLRRRYPEIKPGSIIKWLRAHINHGSVIRVRRGYYQRTQE